MSNKTISMTAVGDIMLGDSSHFIGRGVASRISKYGARYPFEMVSAMIGSSDLFFANLESPLSEQDGENSWEMVYRGSVKAAAGLRLAKHNVVSIANNHILEHGYNLLRETCDCLTDNSIGFAGYRENDQDGNLVWEGEINGISISLFAVSFIKDLFGSETDASRIIPWLLNSVEVCKSDVVMVSVHWGDEYVNTPSSFQIDLAHRLVDAGAAAVIGHHPHVLQPIEEYRGGIIAYSLGNFVFDQDWSSETRGAGMLNIVLSTNGVVEWDFVPTVCDQACRPQLATGKVAAELNAISGSEVGVGENTYRNRLKKSAEKHRIQMKIELIRHFWRVTPATIHFLLTKRNRVPLNKDTTVENGEKSGSGA